MPRPTPRVPPVTRTTEPDRSWSSVMAADRRRACGRALLTGVAGWRSFTVARPLTVDQKRLLDAHHRLHRRPWHRHDRHGQPPCERPDRGRLVRAGRHRPARVARTPTVRVVVLAADGRGFNAGVDIKEMQATEGFDALVGANHGCHAAFGAVYDCKVPVVAAVNGYCLGGGIGLVGNADVIVAADDATFGLPEVDRGALGAATHLARLVPQHKMRAMVYTAATATAAELEHYGSVLRVVPLGRPASRSPRGGGRDRRQAADGHPGGQAVAERHRPGGRAPQLPVRAGVHLRAQPPRGRRRGPGGIRAGQRGPATDARQDDDRGRRGRPARGRHDHRHRGLGRPPQADVDRAGDPALRPAAT